MNKLIKKLNNYRFTSFVASIISLVAAIYGLISFFFYHFAGDVNKRGYRNVGFSSTSSDKYIGMIFFLGCLISIAIAIFFIYSVFPALINKEKVTPKKGLYLANAINSVFILLVAILSLVLVHKENPNTKVAILVALPFGVLSAIGSGLLLIPYIKCEFYMPPIKNK